MKSRLGIDKELKKVVDAIGGKRAVFAKDETSKRRLRGQSLKAK